MAASYSTIEEVVKVVSKHIDRETFRNIVSDLTKVDGNQSFGILSSV